MSAVADILTQGIDVCRVTIGDHSGILSALFFTGLAGSLGHCSGMCGPFVLNMVGSRLDGIAIDRMSEWTRLSGAAAIPYHLGRMVTYSLLGAIAAGAVGHLAGSGTVLQFFSATLLSLAALALLTTAFPKLAQQLFPHGQWETNWAAAVTARARPLFDNPLGARGFALGVVLGFIPCGLLYAAIGTAATSGNALAGAIAMLCFTLGTIPVLIAVGVAGHVASGLWRRSLMMFTPWLMLANGLVLAGLAGKIVWQMMDKG